MKKIILPSLPSLFICMQCFAEDYIIIKYKKESDIAIKTVIANNIQINFHDIKLVQLFATRSINEYEKHFPAAYKFNTSILPAKRLRLFFRIRIPAEKNALLSLINNINNLHSPNIDSSYIGHDMVAFSGGSPNDYYNLLHGANDPEAFHPLDLINAKGAWE